MKEKPYMETKTALTPAERLKVSVAVLVDGWDQHRVAALMGVNQGRVSEAVTAIRVALEGEIIEDNENTDGVRIITFRCEKPKAS